MINSYNNFIPVTVTLLCLLLNPTLVNSAKIVTFSGSTLITSSIDQEIFRARAIENALQNIVLEGNQSLNSFSLVENGKMLLDQIQSSSKVKILKYDVIKETVQNSRYHVTLKAIIDENTDMAAGNVCKKANVENLDFSIEVFKDDFKLPFWAAIDREWVVNELTKYDFSPHLQLAETRPPKKKQNDLYTLFLNEEGAPKPTNIYKLETKIIFEPSNKHSIIEDDIILVANVKTKLKRKEEKIAQRDFTANYVIQKSFFNKSIMAIKRGDWDKIKNRFLAMLTKQIERQISELSCLKINPKVIVKGGIPFLDHGQIDGINSNDMFVISSNQTQKTYLKVVNIDDFETQIEIVSSQATIDDIRGQIVEVVNGS